MTKISMDLVKELREKSQVGMMDCKKALEETNGNMIEAIELLRKKGAAVAAKRAGSATNNGRIEAFIGDSFQCGALVEAGCETDFSANTDAMKDFVEKVAKIASESQISEVQPLFDAHTELKDSLDELLAKISEKIQINKISLYKVDVNGIVNAYIHPGSNVGVMVELATEKDVSDNLEVLKALAKDVCMQVAVYKALCVAPEELDPKVVEKERDIIKGQIKDSKKPENILEKIIDGRLKKFYSEVCLTHQMFIKNDKISVQQHLDEGAKKIGDKITIKRFERFAIGDR